HYAAAGSLWRERRPQTLIVEKRDMGKVEQVLVDERVMSLVVHPARTHRPLRVVDADEIRDQRFIGARRIAHPDPCNRVAVQNRIAAHPGLRRNLALAWNLDASAGRRKLEPMIHAAQVLALQTAHRERRQPMTTSILQGDRLIAAAPID